jgi:hypothetical protein
MQSREISDEQWVSFFNQFSRDHAGWPVTIEVMSPETGPQHLASELPLQGISFDPGGTRPCTISVGAGDSPSANISHVVDMPLHIRLAGAERDDADGTIQIEPARGPVTLVHFHRPEA